MREVAGSSREVARSSGKAERGGGTEERGVKQGAPVSLVFEVEPEKLHHFDAY